MKTEKPAMSSGMPGLDRVLEGLRGGDNVVWEVDGVQDYLPVLEPFAAEARRLGRKLIYFRFARHAPLLDTKSGAEIHLVHSQDGFERFVTQILDVIEENGAGAFYLFDCLSDLAADWFSDRMLGNFFMITCPYLYEWDTLAYFALLKDQHSLQAARTIADTAQVIIEVYRKDQRLYIHPLKVWQRHSPSMYALHSWEGAEFKAVTSSATATDILASIPKPWLEFTIHRPGIWVHTFQQAQQTLNRLRQGEAVDAQAQELFQRLVRMVATRDERFLSLAQTYFDLADMVEITQRVVGTGLIGGKSLGMLLARAILRKKDPRWAERLESHDSFYVGSDVFYTYLVQNGCWWLRRRPKDFDFYLQRAAEARRKILQGVFPENIRHEFIELLEYFGQSPLIVRSSSLLEDNYGNAFSGKYESVFLANQGSPQQRLEALLNAVRTVYASAMSEEGLRYRLENGLLDRDEQMALLVQRVSGELQGDLFLPQVAGVGFSFNPFVWNEEIEPQAGMLRLVFGLGTRAVERTEDDYTRLVALNAPLKRPEATPDEIRQYAQRHVDALDLAANRFTTLDFGTVARAFPPELLDWFVSTDEPVSPEAPDQERPCSFSGYLTFERLFADTVFIPTMRELLSTLQQAYNHPVDIEFTANFAVDGSFRINLVQCRPFQVKIKGEGSRVHMPDRVEPNHLLFESHGPVVGHSLATVVDRLIYVMPSVYSQLTVSQRYSVARTIGRLVHLEEPGPRKTIMLIGPGRWGTSMPWLGVPVSFAEISRASVVCELAVMHEGLIPEVSLGTHFFNDLVEMDILYLAIVPGKADHRFNEDLLRQGLNRLPELVPGARELVRALWVIDSFPGGGQESLLLTVDSMQQKGICYWEKARGNAHKAGL